jgi:hypothetical protein
MLCCLRALTLLIVLLHVHIADGINGAKGFLYRCIGKVPQGAKECASGCKVVPGANDVCK